MGIAGSGLGRDADGHALVVRNGKSRTRGVTIGSGTIAVSAPRVNDRRGDAEGERCKFTSRILPPYMRRSPKVAEDSLVAVAASGLRSSLRTTWAPGSTPGAR